ncbi:hypothetical protein, partial [Membranihabitans maritimus]|uniref:hypothetical protein n=1 Tax=Membranihabitans maritimus TaxID=2904244 RepID=UPI001F1DFD4D
MMKRLIFIFFHLCFYKMNGQEIYYKPQIISSSVEKLDAKNCIKNLVDDFDDLLISPELGIFDMTFHPDGHLYLTTQYRLLRYNVSTGEVTDTISIGNLIKGGTDNYFLAASEEGRFVISGGTDDSGIYDYDLRNRTLINEIDDVGIYAANAISGIIGKRFFLSTAQKDSESFGGIWDPVTKETELINVVNLGDFTYFISALDVPTCSPLRMINFRKLKESDPGIFKPVEIDVESGIIEEICPALSYPSVFFGIATPTDFRQSPLRIDLDADNSTGHITAGYYDTLTTCIKEAPLMAEDIEISTCGAEVDRISFRLKYYDQPRLPEEEIYSEGYEEQLRQTSASRWEWTNPYGDDEDRVKAFLRSLRYRADWDPSDPEERRERAVAVTMHVGEDSTSSWSV